MGKIWSIKYLLASVIVVLSYTVQFGKALENPALSFRLAPDSDLSYDEEYKIFLAEEEDDSHLSRQKRFVYLNVDTNMAVALLVGVPLTFVLPSMSNLFNSWRKKRSIKDSTAGNAWMFHDHNVANPEMEKVSTYFQLLDIPEASCQLRAVCEFSADPEKFYPLSDVILKRIRNPGLPSLAFHEGNNESSTTLLMDGSRSQKKSLYELYNQAADEGQAYGMDRCDQHFTNSCHYPIEKLLNMPVIRFWSALQTLLKFSFKDVSK